MENLPRVHATVGAHLPLQTTPLVFAVRNSGGTTENLWGVDVARGQNAFVYCSSRYRFDDDHWQGQYKSALRRVGHNEGGLAPGILMHLLPGRCLWLRWPENRARESMLPCYTLYLPDVDWAVRLTDAERTRRARKFRRLREPHVLIDGARKHGKVVAVSFLLQRVGVRVGRVNGHPVSTIGVLPFDSDVSIHVTVALDPVERLLEVRKRMSAELSRLSWRCWSEEAEETVYATMGNDEVGYATLVRRPQTVSAGASATRAACDAWSP